MSTVLWPSPRDFLEAIQSPQICFSDRALRDSTPAVDRLGLPLVASGGFASVFKLNPKGGAAPKAIRCFRGSLGDRERRYRELSAYVEKHPAGPLARYQYTPEGMLVGGLKYPILIMDWVEGSTLDVYIAEVLKTPNAKRHLRHLADQWLTIMSILHEGGIAHGDLQHGNILVNNGACTLVDFDGFFVPALAGLRSTDNGHVNYQHPKRGMADFDGTLDRFSGLVIYLSLIALERRPELWAEHHDENLLFQRSDFEQPAQSVLLNKIKKLDAECQRLGQALENACHAPPQRCPYLLDIVDPKTRRAVWKPGVLDVVAAPTREVVPGQRPRTAPAAPPHQRRIDARILPRRAPVPIQKMSALQWVRMGSAWMALWACLASLVPVLQPWASGAAIVFVVGGWPELSRWRMARRLTAAWGFLALLAVTTPLHWLAIPHIGVSSVSTTTGTPRRREAQLIEEPTVNPNTPRPKAAVDDPQVAVHVAAAEKLFQDGDLEKSLLECDRALAIDPQNGQARWLRDQISNTRNLLQGKSH